MSILPKDIGLLLSRGTKIRLIFAVTGLVMVSGLDMLGVLSMVPLMGMFTGMDRDSGVLKMVAEVIGGSPDDATLTMAIAGAALSAFVLKGVVTIAFRWWQSGFLARQQTETAVRLLKGYLLAPYSMHLSRNKSELMRNLNSSISETYNSALNGMLALIAELITVLAIFGVLFVLQPLLTLGAVVYLGMAAGVMQIIIRKRAASLGARLMAFAEESLRHVLHALGAVKEVKLRNNPDPFVQDYQEARFGEAMTRREFGFLTELPKYLLEIVFIVGVAILAAVLFSTAPPDIALPLLALFAAAGVRVLPSLVRMLASAANVRFGQSGMRKLISELQMLRGYGVLDIHASEPASRFGVGGDVRIEDVYFAYESGTPVLGGIDIAIPRGSSAALVGPSGSGKSTLVDLILGLQVPDSGRIKFGGRNIHDDLPSWQSQVGIVPQDVFLMDTSLRRNIAFDEADEDIDEQRLTEAINRAQLQDLVAGSADGLETTVGDRGVRLSGGQRQRIGIARALYRRPSVLVLDEATSALDNETERKITETIESLHGEMTIIIVAHRLSTVRRADQFIVLSAGQIEASGPFEEVIQASPSFARMVELASMEVRPDSSSD